MLKNLQHKLDAIVMYKVVLVGLSALAFLALVLHFFNILTYSSVWVLLGMLALLLITCYFSNLLLGKTYKIPAHQDSAVITALILFFILDAPSKPYEWLGIVFAALVAMASKYIITRRGAAIFNPAALGVFAVSLIGVGYGAWWVAREELFLPAAVLGFLVLVKLRRFELFFAFFIPALLLILIKTLSSGTSISSALIIALTLYPMIFLGTIMLTEPGTMPGTRNKRLVYGALVGLIFGSQLDVGFLSTSPHTALLAGNVFTLAVSTRSSSRLRFVAKKRISPTTYDFAFEPERPIRFIPGQYIELTMPGTKSDGRGRRRTFTISSIPHDKLLHFGIKFYEPGSWFKDKLLSLKLGEELLGNHVAGDFRLPKDTKLPLVFLAGGIGITPFISMFKAMLETKNIPDTTLYYFVKDDSEAVYKEILQHVKEAGVKIVLLTGAGATLPDDNIKRHKGSIFFLSGPPGFVDSYKSRLVKSGVKKINTDYFTGY